MERVLGEGAEIADRFAGARDGRRALRAAVRASSPARSAGAKGHTVLPADFVSADDGTGIVHTAIAFGEDDFRLGAEQGLAVVNPVRLDGTYDERIGPYAGRWVKDADPDLIEDLRARGRLLRAERLLHAYPHCWRCGTPLLYYAKPSWYIRTVGDARPPARGQRDGRRGTRRTSSTGASASGWRTTSTGRSRASATGARRCPSGAARTATPSASARSPRSRSARAASCPTRTAPTSTSTPGRARSAARRCAACPRSSTSGSTRARCRSPSATRRSRTRSASRATFPADYICEAIDQTRGWFYSLIAISTLLFDASPYRTVLCLGHIADPQGKKMSKSLGNIVVPWDVIHQHGADAFRWYFLTSKQPWDGYLFSTETVGESVRQFLLQLWNTYGFYVLYANVNDVARAGRARRRSSTAGRSRACTPRWPRSASAWRTTTRRAPGRPSPPSSTSSRTGTCAARAGASGTAIRPPSGRCKTCLVELTQAARAVLPVRRRRDLREPRRARAERPPDRLPGGRPARATRRSRRRWRSRARPCGSAWPRAGTASSRCASRCARRSSSRRARSAPRSSGCATSCSRSSTSRSCASCRRPTSSAPTRSSRTTARSGRASASRCRRSPRRSRRSSPPTSPARCATAGGSAINVDGHDHELGPDDLTLAMQPLDGYQLEREGSHAVALELELDEELRREGLAREVVHAVQNARKAAGLRGGGPHRARARRRRGAARRRARRTRAT